MFICTLTLNFVHTTGCKAGDRVIEGKREKQWEEKIVDRLTMQVSSNMMIAVFLMEHMWGVAPATPETRKNGIIS